MIKHNVWTGKLLVLALFSVLISLTADLLYTSSSKIIYTPDHKMIGEDFWSNRHVYEVSAKRKIPYQFPGPMDAWAGSKKKKIVFSAPFSRDTSLIIGIVDAHETFPPKIRVEINDEMFSEIEVTRGAGGQPDKWVTQGKSSEIQLFIPSERLTPGARKITLSTVAGSWVVLGKISAQIIPKSWEYPLALLGWSVVLVSLATLGVVHRIKIFKFARAYAFKATASLIIVLFTGGGVYAFYLVNSGKATRKIFHDDNGYFLFRSLSKAIMSRMPDGYTQDMALRALGDYVYLTTQPAINENLGGGPTTFVMYGVSWCDQSAAVYLSLISYLNVRGYLAGLYDKNNKSPHTVAYIIPDNKRQSVERDYLQANARVVDTYNNVIFSTQNRNYATPIQICENDFVPNRSSDLSYLYCQNPIIFGSNSDFIKSPRNDHWFYNYIFPYFPETLSWLYLRAGVMSNKTTKPAEKEYLVARMDHLFFRLDRARKGYSEVESKYPDGKWAELAKHYRVRLNDLDVCFIKDGYTGKVPKDLAWGKRKFDS